MNYQIQPDGSISLSGVWLELPGGYPAIDGTAIRPIRTEVTANAVRWQLINGSSLEIIPESTQNSLIIHTRIHTGTPLHDIAPLSAISFASCDRIFVQGKGIGGPTRFLFPDNSTTASSDAVFAVGNEDHLISMHVPDQKRYRSHFEIRDRRISIVFDTEGILPEDGELPDIVIREALRYDEELTYCAREIAARAGTRAPQDPAFHWCSWYYLYHTLDIPTLRDYLRNFSAKKPLTDFRYIQIDAGYFPSCGDWLLPTSRFPNGLREAAEIIRENGYVPGIWIGPFMVGDESALFREHPDWMLKSADGGYVIMWSQYNEPKPWGYRDSHYYVLDTSHPDAMRYILNVFSTLREWGFRMFKTDFLLWGFQDSTRVIRHTPGKTSVEYFRDLMKGIREAIGEDSQWLGCIAPFMPCLGYVDMMRIGGDVGAQWKNDGFGPTNMIQEIQGDMYFNNIYWQNDPDAVLLRDFHIHLKDYEIESLALMQAVSCGVITTSDPVHLISDSRKALLKMITPHGIHNAVFPEWESGRDEVIITAETGNGVVLYIMNPTGNEKVIPINWNKWTGLNRGFVYPLHGKAGQTTADIPYVTLSSHHCALFFVSDQPIETEPENLWLWN